MLTSVCSFWGCNVNCVCAQSSVKVGQAQRPPRRIGPMDGRELWTTVKVTDHSRRHQRDYWVRRRQWLPVLPWPPCSTVVISVQQWSICQCLCLRRRCWSVHGRVVLPASWQVTGKTNFYYIGVRSIQRHPPCLRILIQLHTVGSVAVYWEECRSNFYYIGIVLARSQWFVW